MAPTLDGLALFGPAPDIQATPNPLQRQWSQYPGVSGRQTVFGGGQGAKAGGRVVLAGDTLADLGSAIQTLKNYQGSGLGYVYTDEYGAAWPGMVIVKFEPLSKIMPDQNGFSQEWEIEMQSTV